MTKRRSPTPRRQPVPRASRSAMADEFVQEVMPFDVRGSVSRVVGLSVAATDFPAPLGATCRIERRTGGALVGEVVGFQDRLTLIIPQADPRGVRHGDSVRLVRSAQWVPVGQGLLGRVINAQGEPIDSGGALVLPDRLPLYADPPAAMERPRIREPLSTGVRAMDALLTCGKGQRVGLFAGSGTGKSVLLGMMARYTAADVRVIGLVGERGREVRDFLEKDLGAAGLKRSVVVVSTGDEPASQRLRAAFLATAIAEYFRQQGRDVMLMLDSLTRFATAQREIGLSVGEPPTTKGYPPSVFAMLPRLLERGGRTESGSITAFYAVLVEADDFHEPISDAVRGILDGHIWLARTLAARSHWPAIDVLESISRLMPDVVDRAQWQASRVVRELLSVHRENEDLITVGAYHRGANPKLDLAVQMNEPIQRFLRQDIDERSSLGESRRELERLVALRETFAAAGRPTASAGVAPAAGGHGPDARGAAAAKHPPAGRSMPATRPRVRIPAPTVQRAAGARS